ncbi:MAG: hypothetical protein AB1390_05385 [Nitrospirota bacterium]
MNKQIFVKISRFILFLLAFFLVFAVFNAKIWDPDFWWHLKTGEYIYQTKSLPEKDPFAFTSLPKDPINPESKRIKFILTQYWVAQVLFYAVYKVFNFQGIIYMRAAILTLLMLLLYAGIRRERVGFLTSFLLLAPAVLIFYNFTGERPQLFSFLFSFLTVYLLEGYRKATLERDNTSMGRKEQGISVLRSEIRYILPIPVLMILWANMHGGFILGIAIIAGYMCAENVKYFLKKTGPALPLRSLKYLIVFGFLSIFSSLINPNGYNVIPLLIEINKSLYMKTIVEAKSPLVFLQFGYYTQELFTFLFLLIFTFLLFLINVKKLDITDIMLFVAFAAMSLSAARVIPFFTPISILMIARYGGKTLGSLSQKQWFVFLDKMIKKPFSGKKSSRWNILVPVLLSIFIVIVLNNNNFFHEGVRKGRYPDGAVRFLKENKISGNMFNPYLWGGYLIWALYPDYKVFIDGRGLIEEIYFQSNKILEASSFSFAGMPEWKAILDAYDINFIVTFSVADFTGKLVPLIPALYNDPAWYLIYMDDNSVIFIRERPQNSDLIERLKIPKEWVWNEIIMEASQKARDFKNRSDFYVTMGDAFLAKRSYPDALTAYLKAEEISPQSAAVQERLRHLKSLIDRAQ